MDRIAILFSLVLLTSFSWARQPLTDQEVSDIIDQFQYDSQYTEISSKKYGGAWDSCWEYDTLIETQFPEMVEPLEVKMTIYMPNRKDLGSETVPTVIMLPPTGGKNFLDKKMGKSFCSSNMAAVIIENDFANILYQADEELLPPEDHELSYYRTVSAVKAVMKMAHDDINMNGDKIGLFGVSLGGILGSFVMATQEQISAGYFIVAGGDVPYILAYSQQDEVSRIRRKRMKEQGFTEKSEYEGFLRTHLTMDPMDLAKTMIPETLHMVIAKKDKNVPTANQLSLHQAYGEPDASFSNSGHVDTVIDTLLFGSKRRRVTNFFKKRFEQDNPRPQAFQWLSQFSLMNYL